MIKLCDIAYSCLDTPRKIFGFIALISFTCLAAAFIAEGVFELEPCKLCIYQRYPFAIALALGLIGMSFREYNKTVRALLGIISLNFLTNSAVAFYHTGIEQKWWESAVDGCAVPIFDNNSGKSVLENIMSAPLGNCSEIAWQDPILGLSMANYNIILCFMLFLFCIVKAFKRPKPLKAS
ncbi:MAG: disulfide bond formation protein B [Alphaproteobacteria bacterium]|nr:disulfide bond formation protein B [Alphaproteobacteria bacterium]